MTLIVAAGLIATALVLRFFARIDVKAIATFYLLGAVIALFAFTVAEMPPFGSPLNPVFNEVSERYLTEGPRETGAVNVIAGVIADYRAFDTLGEATVLFVAIAAVVATLKSH